jgi:uncharacterized protein
MSRPFSLLVKPASADCNLRCAYCFYLDRCALYPEAGRHRMPSDVLERMIGGYLATPQPVYAFGWQGGEPLLMGPEFFRQVVALQQRHGASGAHVANGLQTNGMLLTDALAGLFAEYGFLLGVSLDGPPDIHDRYRRTADGRPTHADVLRGIGLLQKHRVEFNILVLVSAANVRRGREVYRYLRDQGFGFHQYIPCVEFDAGGRPEPFAITGRQWGDFLCAVFDEWVRSDTRRVSVRHFDSVVARLVGAPETVCHMQTNCCQYFVVEHNGDVYPCDFFVERDLRLGNVMADSWDALRETPAYREFGARKAAWSGTCARCRHVGLCAGDCLKHRLLPDPRDPRRLSWLCAGWRQFYDHTLGEFRRLAAAVEPSFPHPAFQNP